MTATEEPKVEEQKGQRVDKIAEASKMAAKRSMERYVMPRASIGMSVVWHAYGEMGTPGAPGIVCELGNRTLSISIFLPGKTSVMYKDGVRHSSDPDAGNEEFKVAGCWDYSEQTKEIMALRSAIEGGRAAYE